MRVAIPISDDWIAPIFDSATRLLVVDIRPGGAPEQSEIPSFVRPPYQRSAELVSLGVDILLCNGISNAMAQNIKERGIEIKSSISWALDELLVFLTGKPQNAVSQPVLAC